MTRIKDHPKTHPAVPSDLVSVPEAAAIGQMNPRTIWKKIRNGTLPAYGSRKCYRVSLSQLLAPVRPKNAKEK